MSQQQDILTDHSYDGIREYDNPTPGWWTWIFILSIIFSIVYFVVVTLIARGELSPIQSYEREKVEQIKRQYGTIQDLPITAATILKLSKDEKWLSVGASLFQTNCVACHGREATGITGPNLTDDYYINVQKVTDIYDVIKNGRNSGAMPAWGQRLEPAEVLILAGYVASLRGKDLPGKPVEPNAKKAPPWSE